MALDRLHNAVGRHWYRRRGAIACLALAAAGLWTLSAAPAGGQLVQPGPEPPPGFVRLNLQGQVRLAALIDYVSQRLGIQFIYDQEVAAKEITVRAPQEIPVDSLLALLGSVLKMEGFIMVDADVPGWKRIVQASKMPNLAPAGQAAEILAEQGPATPVTQVFLLRHVNAPQVAQAIRPFQTQPGSNVLALPESNVLVVTDYSPTVLTIERLIQLLDQPRGGVTYEFYTVEHLEAAKLATQVKNILATRAPAAGAPTPRAAGIDLLEDTRTNQIVIVGSQELVKEAVDLLRRFDVPLDLTTRVYRFQYISPDRIDRVVREFISPRDLNRVYKSSPDKDANLLVVTGTAEIHQRIEQLSRDLDVPVKSADSPIRFYKLKNANVTDVLYTLLALQEAVGGTAIAGGLGGLGIPGAGGTLFPGGTLLPGATTVPGGLLLPGQSILPYGTMPGVDQSQPLRLPLPPAGDENGGQQLRQMPGEARAPGAPAAPGTAAGMLGAAGALSPFGAFGSPLAALGAATLPGGARVSADVGTNSLVIVAPSDVQQMYAALIEALDVRRPQVLIEAKIIAVDTTDNFSLGVEVSAGDRQGEKRWFRFTSFGLSEVDPTTGALAILPALGFNGTVVNPDVADVVVQALASHRRARVLAAPKILVNDNSTGQLESVVSIPFQSVNASQTVSTTSLGGDQQAGTTITVTPHINESRHLLLEFSVEFSSFQGGAASPNLPPPRQIDRVESTVTIPNGQTIIVGGLKQIAGSKATLGLPFFEKVPLLRELTSSNTKGSQTTSFFLFIRPLILNDDKFHDLKYVSEKSAGRAGVHGEHPASHPLLVE